MSKKEQNKTRRKYIIGGFMVMIIGAITLATVFLPKPSNYLVAEAELKTIENYYTFSGNAESKNTQIVMADSSLQISEIKVVEGEKVEKDDVLFVTKQGINIKAKIAGTVTEIYVEDDEQVMAGTKLCDLYDLDNLQVKIMVDEYDLSSISKDKEIYININALNKEIKGKVESISDVANIGQGISYFTALISVPIDKDIKVGMTVEAKVIKNQAENVVTIPIRALNFDDDNKAYVFIKNDNKEIVKKIVDIGLNDGIFVEVTKGLVDGQKIYIANESSSGQDSGILPPMPTN